MSSIRSNIEMFFFVILLIAPLSIRAGLDSETMVETSEGRIKMGALKVGSELICQKDRYSKTLDSIKSIEHNEVDKYLNISFAGGNKLDTMPDQKVYVTKQVIYDKDKNKIATKKIGQWMKVADLVPGHVVKANKINKNSNEVLDIQKKYGRKILTSILMNKIHNYYSTHDGLLVHNGAWGAYLGCTLSMSLVQFAYHTTVIGVSSLAGPAAPGVAGVIYLWTSPAVTGVTYAAGVAGGMAGAVATGPV